MNSLSPAPSATTSALVSIPDMLKPRQASTLLLWVIVTFFVAFIAWAALTELDRTVRGQGRVVASSQLQTVSNLEGGIVSEILVRTGQIVRRGQPLVRLDPTATGAELGQGEASTFSLRAKIARLRAEVLGRTPAYPGAPNAAAAEQVEIQRALHSARMAELAGITGATAARRTQAERGVAEASETYAGRVSARDARAEELRTIRDLVARGIEPRLALSQADAAASVARAEAAAAAEATSRARAQIAETISAEAQTRQDWRARAADELATAQAELEARSQGLPALQGRVDRTVVRAPLNGRVNRVLVTTVGAAVPPGAPIAEIVPSEETLVIEARVRPQDIANVRIGQDARVNVTAYDSSIFGSMDGSVETISPDAITPEDPSQESYYVVKVRTLTKGIRDKSGRLLPIGTGMTTEVNLLGDKRTILQYILTPITRLSERAFRE